MGNDKLIPLMCGEPQDSILGQEIQRKKKHIFEKKYVHHIKMFPHADALIQKMHSAGLKVMVLMVPPSTQS